MIFDFDTGDASVFESSDICIIGGGAAGICIANEFVNTNHRVVLLESGGMKFEQATQDLYKSEVNGLPHLGVHSGRARILGGTTTLWAGQALPLSPMDFQQREWIPHSGWPLDYVEVSGFYSRAEKVMKIPHTEYNLLERPGAQTKLPQFDQQLCFMQASIFSNNQNFAISYMDVLRGSANVNVLLHANVTNVDLHRDGGFVQSVTIRSLGGRVGVNRSKYYIICCGAIETARLLLASNNVAPNGIGNDSGLVGRFFQEHLHVTPVPIHPADKAQFASQFNSFRMNGFKRVPKIAATEEFQSRQKTLNIGAEIVYPPDEQSSIEAAKRLYRMIRGNESKKEIYKLLGLIVASPASLVRAAIRHFVAGQSAQDTSGQAFIGICSEQSPNPNSRIYLSDERDALGMRRSVVDWQLTSLDVDTVCTFTRSLKAEFARLGIGEIDFDEREWSTDPNALSLLVHDSSHHMGTTKMSAHPADGVVNSHCQVHGTPNLYVASSSVFPTSGYSNPTLTILALSLRIADQLKGRLATGVLT